MVALLLVEHWQSFVEAWIACQKISDSMLHRRADSKSRELMDLPEFGGQVGWRSAVSELPARRMKRLAERADHHRSFPEFVVAKKTSVRFAIEHNVLVDLV